MTQPRRPVQASRPTLGPAESRAAERALDSGYLGMGPETRAFESELEAFLGGGRTVLCTNTGTSALHLAVAGLGLRGGDEVLVPSLTFVASFQAIALTGAAPVACDVGEADALIDLADARRRLTPRCRAIMPVHYAGYPGAIGRVRAFAREHRLRVIEDAAHAFGTRHEGGLVGAGGDITCFSFDPIKNITCGQGGALVSDDAALLDRVRRMRNLGLEAAAPGGGGDAIEVRGPGWRYQMSDLMAAIGRVQLARFEAELKPARVALAARYREGLSGCRGVTPLESGPEVVPHIFPIRVGAGRRDELRVRLRERGYESLVHYHPAHLLAAFRGPACPVAERLHGELLTLPLHGNLVADDVDRVVQAIREMMDGA